MPVWQRRLKLGTYFRIGVYVHWSFALLVAYVAYSGYQDGPIGALFGVLLLAGMFLCVTLHEYGHALTARRFGIETLDITLYPIGGVARLMKIPRVPWQELLVAVAGPAVNVVIVVALALILTFAPGLGIPSFEQVAADDEAAMQLVDALNSPTMVGFLMSMMLVNTALILFNMIPAFPMDGGRVLRSLLAMGLEYRRATRIASNIGIACAVLMGIAAIHYGFLTAGLIAVFICYAGLSEARQVEAIEPIRHLRVRDAMIFHPPFLTSQTPIAELIDRMRSCPTTAVPVVDESGVVLGLLTIELVSEAIRGGADGTTSVGEIVRRDVPVLSPSDSLESVLTRPVDRARQYPVADEQGFLVGMLDLESLRLRAQLAV